MKTIKDKISLIGLVILGMLPIGCSKNYHYSYEGYPVEISKRSDGKYLLIYDKGKNMGEIKAIDRENDGRYDEIYLNNITKGSDIESLANLKTIQTIDQQVRGIEEKE